MFIYIKQYAKHIKRKYIINKVSLRCGFYFEILFKGKAKKSSLSKALKKCGRHCRLPIVSEDICLPIKEKWRLICLDTFDNLLYINAFSHIIQGCEKALIIDKDGGLCDLILLPLTRVRTLYILTSRPDLYEKANERALFSVGACSIILEKIEKDITFSAVLMPFGTQGLCPVPHQFTIIGKGGYEIFGNEVIFKNKRYDKALMAAIYLCLNDKSVGLSSPAMLYNGDRRISPQGLKAKIKGSGN